MTRQTAVEKRTDPSDLKHRLGHAARAAGFEGARVVSVDALGLERAGEGLDTFVALGRHGDMDWMATTLSRRRTPRALWPEASSAIVLAMNYGPDHDPIATGVPADRGVVSCYARGKDYHDVVKKALKRVAGWLHRETGAEVKVFVDTAPLMEKPLAEAAGLGWQGKHTNLVSRELGSWFFLGCILTTLALPPDDAASDHCGRCRRCLDICPTDAFPAPYQLDARRCISYLTIEHKGHIAAELRPGIGNRVFGCDDCLAVCPWNKFAQEAREARFHARAEVENPPLAELLGMDDAAFAQRFKGTPVKRTGRDRMVRNALIAAGNSGDGLLAERVVPLLRDRAAIVRAMAVWAAGQLMSREGFLALRREHDAAETDADVKAEWQKGAEG